MPLCFHRYRLRHLQPDTDLLPLTGFAHYGLEHLWRLRNGQIPSACCSRGFTPRSPSPVSCILLLDIAVLPPSCWQQFDPRSLLEHAAAILWTRVNIEAHCFRSENRGICCIALFLQWLRITLLQQWPGIQMLHLLFRFPVDVIVRDTAWRTLCRRYLSHLTVTPSLNYLHLE
jgi:hypothetical protein